MSTFYINETHSNNLRDFGDKVEAVSLRVAKQLASKARMFKDTMITVANSEGKVVAYKRKGSWISVN